MIETRREGASRVEPEERVADLLCVLEASRRLAALAELPPLLELVEQSTQRVLDCERAFVFLYKPYTEELVGQVAPEEAPSSIDPPGAGRGTSWPARSFVTDGLFEWLDPRGECSGIDRLQSQLRRDTDRPAAEIIRSLHQSVLAFSCGSPQLDDLAAVVIKRA